ncbi:hypothetical protein ACHAXR_009805 [Thalassiosira sp. AJA248-18]
MTKTKKNQSRTKQKQNSNGDGGASSSATTAGNNKKRKREAAVKVVVCPSAFPDFTTVGGSTSRRQEQQRTRNPAPAGSSNNNSFLFGNKSNNRNKDDNDGPLALDVQETIREIHKFGAEGFTGKQKKSHQAAEYERLTGRVAKRQKIPTKIIRGMRAKAMKREERHKQELKESGVVHAAAAASSSSSSGTTKKKKRDKKPEDDHKAIAGPRGVFGSNRSRNTGDRRDMKRGSFGPAPDVGFMRKGMLKVKQPRW